MAEIRIISDPQDRWPRRTTRTIDDALNKLVERGELTAESQLELFARSAPSRLPFSAALLFKSSKGDDALFALPISQGCWATSTLGNRFYMTLERLDGAEVDYDGNVTLKDGTYFHAVSFDVLSLHFELPELEEAIVYLTIRYLKAEAQCLRNDHDFIGIDYSTLPRLRVPSVKALTRYVNATIATTPRRSGARSFKNVSIATVHRTLDLVHVQKVMGRPKGARAALHVTASP